MTVYDLVWRPILIGTGFAAVHRFGNGRIAYVSCGSVTPDGEDYRLTIREGGRVVYSRDGLDRTALNARLSYHEMLS